MRYLCATLTLLAAAGAASACNYTGCGGRAFNYGGYGYAQPYYAPPAVVAVPVATLVTPYVPTVTLPLTAAVVAPVAPAAVVAPPVQAPVSALPAVAPVTTGVAAVYAAPVATYAVAPVVAAVRVGHHVSPFRRNVAFSQRAVVTGGVAVRAPGVAVRVAPARVAVVQPRRDVVRQRLVIRR